MNFINSILLFFALLLLGPSFISNSETKDAKSIQLAAKKIDPFQDMVLVRGGTYAIGMNTEESEMRQWNNPYRRATVSTFRIDKYEVSNKKYRDYIHWLEKAGQQYAGLVKDALPDTLVWREPLAYNEPMVQGYFRAKAFNDYPVVGVTWVQANNYCRWRTDRANENILFNYGLIPDPKTTPYMGKLADATGTPATAAANAANPATASAKKIKSDEEYIVKPDFRLPTEAEWEYAAKVSSSKNYISNFNNQKAGSNSKFSNASVVESDSPYPWGGVGVEDLRNTKKGKQGMYMANFKSGNGDYMGMIGYSNDGAGFPAKVNSYLQNKLGLYNISGNVNEWVADIYRPLSSRDVNDMNPYRGDSTLDGDEPTLASYDSEVSTLISNKSRVYKGGSWKDRPYWLNIGTRRYLDQDKSSSSIGFRCVSSAFGYDAASKDADNSTPWWKRLFKK
jgi:formylglycine-generating enzyme required for sulfatase activity